MAWPTPPVSPVKRGGGRSRSGTRFSEADARRQGTAETSRLLSEMAPQIMTPAMVQALTKASLPSGHWTPSRDPFTLKRSKLLLAPKFSMDHPARSLARISNSLLAFSGLSKESRAGAQAQPATSMDVGVLEESQRILEGAATELDAALDTALLDAAEAEALVMEEGMPVSLLRGFQATVPQAQANKTRRRMVRAIVSAQAANSTVPRRERISQMAHAEKKLLSLEELEQQNIEIQDEVRNIQIRRNLCKAEIMQVDARLATLEATRASLQQKLLDVREEELELDDECT